MCFVKLNKKLFFYDESLGITFVFENNSWQISRFPLHELENMNLNKMSHLTISEIKNIANLESLQKLQIKIKKIYEDM